MAFLPRKYQLSDSKSAIIDNSLQLTVGQVIIPGVTSATSVAKNGGGTTSYLLGIVMGFKDIAGLALEKNSYTAASNNVTVAQVRAEYQPLALTNEIICDLTANAETTTGSGEFGNFAVDSTGLLVSEASYVVFGTRTNVQLFSYGLTGDPMHPRQISGVFFASVGGAQS